jgi:hypothetical protein
MTVRSRETSGVGLGKAIRDLDVRPNTRMDAINRQCVGEATVSCQDRRGVTGL